MAFVDVDELIFSMRWAQSSRLFAPLSGGRRGVRRRAADLGLQGFRAVGAEQPPRGRSDPGLHVSAVGAVADELDPRAGFRWERSRHARLNHYKYQAWDEFKEFRRCVSTAGHVAKFGGARLGFKEEGHEHALVCGFKSGETGERHGRIPLCFLNQNTDSIGSWRPLSLFPFQIAGCLGSSPPRPVVNVSYRREKTEQGGGGEDGADGFACQRHLAARGNG